MDTMDEIKELLREIRDLQKAHFERYKEFTQAALERQQANAEQAERSRDEQRRARDENRRYREEMRDALDNNQHRLRTLMAGRSVMIAIVVVLALLSVGSVVLSIVLRMPMPYR